MTRIIVERHFETPATDADLAQMAARQQPCQQIYNVHWKRSLLSVDRRRMQCEYEAADLETVRTVQRESRSVFDQVWAADLLE